MVNGSVSHVPAFGAYVPTNQDKQGYNISTEGPLSSGLSVYFPNLTECNRIKAIVTSGNGRGARACSKSGLHPHRARPEERLRRFGPGPKRGDSGRGSRDRTRPAGRPACAAAQHGIQGHRARTWRSSGQRAGLGWGSGASAATSLSIPLVFAFEDSSGSIARFIGFIRVSVMVPPPFSPGR